MASYLNRLIDRATNIESPEENNTIGAYRISPQHSGNTYVYNIYKNHKAKDKPAWENHIATIKIITDTCVYITDYKCSKDEIDEIEKSIKEFYTLHEVVIDKNDFI